MNLVLSLLVLTALFIGNIWNQKLVLKLNSSSTISEVEITNDVAGKAVIIPHQEDWNLFVSSDLHAPKMVTSFSFLERSEASNSTLNMLYLGHSPPCLT